MPPRGMLHECLPSAMRWQTSLKQLAMDLLEDQVGAWREEPVETSSGKRVDQI
jgi:hypothetical protein